MAGRRRGRRREERSGDGQAASGAREGRGHATGTRCRKNFCSRVSFEARQLRRTSRTGVRAGENGVESVAARIQLPRTHSM